MIEVGVDVPNASLMVIEHAERMGLSQLHQLRGRVGRGARGERLHPALPEPAVATTARERLRIIYENTDGFEIARHDLRMRGPGELLGARQSGVPLLRFADLETRPGSARGGARRRRAAAARWPERAEAHLARWLGGRQEYLRV